MRVLIAAAALAIATCVTFADEATDAMKAMTNVTTAREVSQIIATADLCHYQLSEDKVGRFVTEKIAAMDEMSRLSFQSAGGAQKIRIKNMSAVERAAACALQAKLAEKYDLLP